MTGPHRPGHKSQSSAHTALIASVPFVDSVPVLLGMIAVSIGCIATNTSQVFALTNDLLPNPGDIGKAISSYNAAFVIAGAMMLIGMSSALFVANRPMVVTPLP